MCVRVCTSLVLYAGVELTNYQGGRVGTEVDIKRHGNGHAGQAD